MRNKYFKARIDCEIKGYKFEKNKSYKFDDRNQKDYLQFYYKKKRILDEGSRFFVKNFYDKDFGNNLSEAEDL